ncbi:MAG: hypothetical protein IPP38_10015 [Bacteroidetes bacterium]|nr:hypothetical protein [Bacteroidota bacterium]
MRFNNIFAIHEDHTGMLWIEHQTDLLNMTGKAKRLCSTKHNPVVKSSLSNNYIRCIKEDKSGTL